MGLLSCNAESAIAICDSQIWDLTKIPRKNPKKPFIITEFSYSDLDVATNGFSNNNLLGQGSHGSVYRAHIQKCNLIAAVKKTKIIGTLENEIDILSRVRHARLVNVLGYAVDLSSNKKKLIVVEYMPNGSLYEWLHCNAKPPCWRRRVRFALQIACGVQFLHSSNPPIIHRDIKSSNVLIDGKLSARLGDFGLAHVVDDDVVKSIPPAGTLGYLDPCYLTPSDLSTKSDVFSFGILLLEIVTGRNAIDVNYSPASVVDWAVPLIKSGDYTTLYDPRMDSPLDETVIIQLLLVSEKCVRKTPEKRPAMTEVSEWLKIVYKQMNSPIWNQIGRRVGRVTESTRVVKYEALDESVEVVKISRVGSRRNRKVSSVTSVELRSDVIGWKGNEEIRAVGRSKSIGSLGEIRSGPLDGRRKGGLAVKLPTVRLGLW